MWPHTKSVLSISATINDVYDIQSVPYFAKCLWHINFRKIAKMTTDKHALKLTIIILLNVRVAAVHLEIINSPVGVRLRIDLQMIFIAGITATRMSPKITVNSKLETLSMNLNNPHTLGGHSRIKEVAVSICNVKWQVIAFWTWAFARECADCAQWRRER